MAHYALLNENNLVINVITGVDEHLIQSDLDGTQVGGSTEAWEKFYASRPWLEAKDCKRTSYNGKIRKNFAGIGYTYDPMRDAFIPPKPFESWILDEETCQWKTPVEKPDDEKHYCWDENLTQWIEIIPSNY